MDKAGLEACAGFLVRETGACSLLVELGLVPLVCRAVLCSCPVDCWTWDILELEPGGGCGGQCLGVKMAAYTSILVPTASHSHSLHPKRTLQDQQVDLAQGPMKSLTLPLTLICARSCPWTCPPRAESLHFPQSKGAHEIKPLWSSKPNVFGFLPLMLGPKAWESDVGPRTLTFVGKLWQ